MTSLNKDSSEKDILDDRNNILVVNDASSYMSELFNATMVDLNQTSTTIPQMINMPRLITKMNGLHCLITLHRLVVSCLLPPFSSHSYSPRANSKLGFCS